MSQFLIIFAYSFRLWLDMKYGDVIYCLRYVNTYSFCSYVIELCKKGTSALAAYLYTKDKKKGN